jgi:hypothetical protein
MTLSSKSHRDLPFPAWGQMAFPVFIGKLHVPLLRTRITRPYRTSVALEEERPWVGFYRRVANPAIAAEVIQHLDGDADQKRTHPALYLRCKESLRKKKARRPHEAHPQFHAQDTWRPATSLRDQPALATAAQRPYRR